jgi:hypothetical protein
MTRGTEVVENWASPTGQQGGTHYTGCAIQPITFIEANELPFSEGNVVKYVVRHLALSRTAGLLTLLKAMDYCRRILAARYSIDTAELETWLKKQEADAVAKPRTPDPYVGPVAKQTITPQDQIF